jgi:hypothetical protein
MFSSDDFDSHKCELKLTANKEIPVVYYNDSSYGDKKAITAWGVDGVLYTLEVTPRRPILIAMCPSDDSYHEPESDDKLPVPIEESLKSKSRNS